MQYAVNITFLLLERAPTPGCPPMGAFLRCYISVFALPNFLEGTKPKPITIVQVGLYIDIIYFVVSILVPVGISWGSTADEWSVKMTISIFASHNTVVCAAVCISKPLYCVMQNKNMAGGNYCFDWPFVAFQVCELYSTCNDSKNGKTYYSLHRRNSYTFLSTFQSVAIIAMNVILANFLLN